MALYFYLIKFNFLRLLTYPVTIITFVAKYIVKLLFLLTFWHIVSKSSTTELSSNYLISYFLLSIGISDILMSDNTNLGRTIRKSVTRGRINQVLIKPVNLIQYFYFQTVGEIGLKMILALISIFLGIALNPPGSLISVVLFLIFFIEAFFISFAYNLFEGALSLIFTEVGGIKNAMHHVTRVLSGQVVPFSFFPDNIKSILLLTPIPIMVFSPINALSQNSLTAEILLQVILGIFWVILLNFIVIKFWQRNLRIYDAAGA